MANTKKAAGVKKSTVRGKKQREEVVNVGKPLVLTIDAGKLVFLADYIEDNRLIDEAYRDAIEFYQEELARLDRKYTKTMEVYNTDLAISLRKTGIIMRQVRQKRILRRWIVAASIFFLAAGFFGGILATLSKTVAKVNTIGNEWECLAMK